MLDFFAPRTVVANALVLAEAVGTAGEGKSPRVSYLEALERIQPRRFAYDAELAEPVLDFGRSSEGETLIRHFLRIDTVDEAVRFPAGDEDRLRRAVADGLGLLADVYPEGAESVRFLVGSFLFARQPGSGGASLGDQLGVVWLNPPDRWEVVDYAEAILHESVHQALFLHEMVNRVYVAGIEEMELEESRVVSAVRRERRPYDASFHAAVVATELRVLYEKLGNDERAKVFAAGLRQTLPELAGHRHFLTDVGAAVLDQMVAALPAPREGEQRSDVAASLVAGL
jgi:hypothetical protein